jgi:hypothetical protein
VAAITFLETSSQFLVAFLFKKQLQNLSDELTAAGS